MMKNRYIVILIISTLCILQICGSVYADPIRNESVEVHSIEILDAYYIGADIYTSISVCVQTHSGTESYYLKIDLINPDGEIVSLVLHVITTLDQVILDIVFYGYATVAGDYIIDATIITNSNGWFALTDIMIFDPPSGGSEGDPYIGISVR